MLRLKIDIDLQIKKTFFLYSSARTTALEDVLQFKAEFEREYGPVHPTFYQGSYSQVGKEMWLNSARHCFVQLVSTKMQHTMNKKFPREISCSFRATFQHQLNLHCKHAPVNIPSSKHTFSSPVAPLLWELECSSTSAKKMMRLILLFCS